MAITRKLLKGMGLTDEQVDTIIEAHAETVDGLKAQIETYKADAEKLPEVQRELDSLKDNGDWQERYNTVKQEFDDYKASQAAKESHAAKETAYRALLKEAGISEKRIDTILKVSDVDGVELTKDGAIKSADKLTEAIKTEWADFITTTETHGAETHTPPQNDGAGKAAYDAMSLSERMKYANEHPAEVAEWLKQ